MPNWGPLSGEQRKSNFEAVRSVDGLIADIGRGGRLAGSPRLRVGGDGPMSADHAPVGLLGRSVLEIAFFMSPGGIPPEHQGRCSDVILILGKRGIPAKQEALLIWQP